jgi:hypothetical protein
MLEDYGAMGRKIDEPPCAVSIEQSAGASLDQLLPPWQPATGLAR